MVKRVRARLAGGTQHRGVIAQRPKINAEKDTIANPTGKPFGLSGGRPFVKVEKKAKDQAFLQDICGLDTVDVG